MPYATNAELPDTLRKRLPERAQTIYRGAFNLAYERYGPIHEEAARRVAWNAVKRRYVQLAAGVWVQRHHHHA